MHYVKVIKNDITFYETLFLFMDEICLSQEGFYNIKIISSNYDFNFKF